MLLLGNIVREVLVVGGRHYTGRQSVSYLGVGRLSHGHGRKIKATSVDARNMVEKTPARCLALSQGRRNIPARLCFLNDGCSVIVTPVGESEHPKRESPARRARSRAQTQMQAAVYSSGWC